MTTFLWYHNLKKKKRLYVRLCFPPKRVAFACMNVAVQIVIYHLELRLSLYYAELWE